MKPRRCSKRVKRTPSYSVVERVNQSINNISVADAVKLFVGSIAALGFVVFFMYYGELCYHPSFSSVVDGFSILFVAVAFAVFFIVLIGSFTIVFLCGFTCWQAVKERKHFGFDIFPTFLLFVAGCTCVLWMVLLSKRNFDDLFFVVLLCIFGLFLAFSVRSKNRFLILSMIALSVFGTVMSDVSREKFTHAAMRISGIRIEDAIIYVDNKHEQMITDCNVGYSRLDGCLKITDKCTVLSTGIGGNTLLRIQSSSHDSTMDFQTNEISIVRVSSSAKADVRPIDG